MEKCCTNCMEDFYLYSYIVGNGFIGNCDFCEGKEVKCIYLNDDIFNKLFDFVRKMYVEFPVRRSQLLKFYLLERWNLFSENTRRDNLLQKLCEIYNLDSNAYYVFNPDYYIYTNLWNEYTERIKHKNRFVNSLPKELELLFTSKSEFERFKLLREGNLLYRARLGSPDNIVTMPFPATIKDMGMPPVDKVRAGRANPDGIPYLYLASGVDTAIAEVRPWNGSSVTIAIFKLLKNVSLYNFSMFNEQSIFQFINSSNTEESLNSLNFLDYISDVMSQPISPSDSYLEYIPTQYLTEFIKEQGYEGIIFDSSLGPGQNLVLFNQQNIEVINTEAYTIGSIKYFYNQI